MALSEYMPYGAPELLEGASARLARSTLYSSFAVATLVAALGTMFAREVVRVIETPGAPDTIISVCPLPGQPPVYKTRETPPAPPKTDVLKLPRPVPDPDAPSDDVSETPPVPAGPRGDVTEDAGQSPGGGRTNAPPVQDPDPYTFYAVDELPVLIRCAEARYPDLAREAGVEGAVRVLMLVGLDGRVERAIVARGGSVPTLDQAALDAARDCVFTPALSRGHPVKVWVSRSYRFSLH